MWEASMSHKPMGLHGLLQGELSLDFEALTEETTKSIIFWNVMQCRQAEIDQCFGWMYCLHLQGRRALLSASFSSISCLVYSSTLKREALRSSRSVCKLLSDNTASLSRRLLRNHRGENFRLICQHINCRCQVTVITSVSCDPRKQKHSGSCKPPPPVMFPYLSVPCYELLSSYKTSDATFNGR
jgi:hypothetical protein